MNIEAAQTTLTRLCVAALSKNGATQDDIAACREAAAKMRGARSATHLVKQRRLSEADAEQIAAEEGLRLVREPRLSDVACNLVYSLAVLRSLNARNFTA